MGKRSDFARVERDFYPTPAAAVAPLIRHIPFESTYWEPCAGDGDVIKALMGHLSCVACSDIEPRGFDGWRQETDALEVSEKAVGLAGAAHIITNPPWDRKTLHPMIEHFSNMRPTWLLFDADWAHTKQAIPFLDYCQKIVSVGRVSWMENGTSGKDNSAWYLFDQNGYAATEFIGRAA